MTTSEQVRSVVTEVLTVAAKQAGSDLTLADDTDLLTYFDSMTFLGILGDIEARLAINVDFSELDPEQYTRFGGLLQALQAHTSPR